MEAELLVLGNTIEGECCARFAEFPRQDIIGLQLSGQNGLELRCGCCSKKIKGQWWVIAQK